MATEKLAKHFLTPEGRKPKLSHTRFCRFVLASKRNQGIRRACFGDTEMSRNAFAVYLDDIAHVAREMESLAPTSRMNSVNPEYPWEKKVSSSASEIVSPCQYPFDEFNPKKRIEIQHLMWFIEKCFQYLEQKEGIR